jgi:ribonuclease HI
VYTIAIEGAGKGEQSSFFRMSDELLRRYGQNPIRKQQRGHNCSAAVRDRLVIIFLDPGQFAELMAIWYAVKMIQDLEKPTRLQDNREDPANYVEETKMYTIVSDSQSALKAIAKSAAKSGQTIVNRIFEQVHTLRKQHIQVRLCWVLGHANNEGNEAADQLAKQAVSAKEDHDFKMLLSAYRKSTHQMIEKEWRDE